MTRERAGLAAATRFRLDPDTAAESAAPRHSLMPRAILRGYELTEPEQAHAVRLLGRVIHGRISLEATGGFSHGVSATQDSWIRSLDRLDALLRNGPAS
ncbi:hypothetical protein CK936_28830 [Streptomyces albireticuli]|uniref:HTH-type transcriptional regulator MT1864/Rv1816-like C-terminal domain-containing protein n=1 Tax=Streptomyces albireticuli TaxID=1940 RepID=A0A2A2D1W8_9ACTN|nr:hypothetical protein CK936_28830 [Streptomyces albireticuli]